MAVIVYSTNTCPFCNLVKDFLKEHKIEFTEFNVAEDKDKAAEMIKKSGQQGVPVIDANGKIIVGFNKPALIEALNIKE